jgi:hypothetical protein
VFDWFLEFRIFPWKPLIVHFHIWFQYVYFVWGVLIIRTVLIEYMRAEFSSGLVHCVSVSGVWFSPVQQDRFVLIEYMRAEFSSWLVHCVSVSGVWFSPVQQDRFVLIEYMRAEFSSFFMHCVSVSGVWFSPVQQDKFVPN